ncbi:TPA: SDR family NAD(P)-dependent oxidoreductase, partial [Vibrio cholerae]|nr:SDR family NAD(P)-dependent oxidoreductase [Vibrio cholerae]
MSVRKVVVITGGSRGIGAATAKLFAQNGFSVCINYKSNAEAANTLVEEIKALGGHCIAVQADVSKEGDVVKLFETVDQELGVVSVLVNNAGILKKQMRLDEMSAERINSILINNVTG